MIVHFYWSRTTSWTSLNRSAIPIWKFKFQVPFPKERDITRCELRFKPAIPVARHIREFIRWLLNPDERNRPTFNDIQQHAWIKEGRERTERNSTGLWFINYDSYIWIWRVFILWRHLIYDSSQMSHSSQTSLRTRI